MRFRSVAFVLAIAVVCAAPLQAATFLDRPAGNTVRMATWNVNFDSVRIDPVRNAKFTRIANALDPDIWCMEEFYSSSAAQIQTLLDTAHPLPGGAHWNVYGDGGDKIASKFPISLGRPQTSPTSLGSMVMCLVDLPDALFPKDLYVMDAHYKCCGGYDGNRQYQSDAIVSWMRDARTAGGLINLTAGTPMVVTGDLNIVQSQNPLTNLMQGKIVNTPYFGADSAPDWDGASLIDPHPRHNITGTDDYTWRDDNDIYAPGRLDYTLFTGSTASAAKTFILDTNQMSPEDRAATGLQQWDAMYRDNGTYDHLPLVVDFAITPEPGSASVLLIAFSLAFARRKLT